MSAIGVLFVVAMFWALARDKKVSLIYMACFASAFQATSITDTTGSVPFGVMPYYFFLICVSGIALLNFLANLSRSADAFDSWDLVGIYFCLYVLLGALTLPFLFSGTPVFSPADGLDDSVDFKRPLALTNSNYAQPVYILLNTIFILTSRRWVTESIQIQAVEKALKLAGCVVLLASFWQRLGYMGAVAFPDELIRNNFSFSLQSAADIRVPGTFSESSLCGAFLAAMGCAWFASLAYSGKLRAAGATWLVFLLAVMNSLGTTGLVLYPVLSVFAWALVASCRNASDSKRFTLFFFVSALLIALLLVVAFVSSADLQLLASANLLEKVQTSSYENRSASNEYAMSLFLATYGVGLGIGSNRPSSLLFYLLSNLGFIGTLVVLSLTTWLAISAIKKIRAASADEAPTGIFLTCGFVGLCLAQLLSISDMSFPPTLAFASGLTVWMSITRRSHQAVISGVPA